MRMPPIHLDWKKPRQFWPFFTVIFASTAAGCAIDPPHRYYYLASLFGAFFVLLDVIESLASARIADNWGRIERKDHPIRYWLQIGIWLALLLAATITPLAYALMQTKT
jgi:hypothetical protein